MEDLTDPLLEATKEAMIEGNITACVSSIQRLHLIGYNRAARILEALEDAGVVSPVDGHGKRKVLKTGKR